MKKTLAIRSFHTYIIFLFYFSIAFSACQFSDIGFDDVKVEEWNPQFATAIFSSEIQVSDLVAKADSQFLIVRSDDVLEFFYEGEVTSFDLTDLVPAINKQVTESFSPLPPGVITIPTTIEFTDSLEINFDVDPIEIYSIITKSGEISYNISSSYDFPMIIDLTFPAIITQSGTPLNTTISLEANSSAAAALQLGTSTIDFTQLTPPYNRLTARYHIEIPPTSGAVTILPTDELNFLFSVQNIETQEVRCNLGQQSLPITGDSIVITVFENTFSGADITLDSPKVLFEIINEYGVPFNFEFDVAKVLNYDKTHTIAIAFNQNPFFVPDFGTNNNVEVTNVSQLFNFKPDEIQFQPSVEINPNSTPDELNPNIIRDNSKITVNTKIEIPLIGSGQVDITTDTVEIDLSLDENIENFEFAEFRTTIKNNVPVEAKVQYFFFDENGQTLDSLFSGGSFLFPAAPVDSEGLSNGTSEETATVELSKERLDRLLNTRSVVLVAEFQSTPNAPSVKFRNSDFIDFKLGVLTNLKLSVE